MTLDFTNLDAMNRQAEQQLREALGSGTVREEWPRRESFARWVITSIVTGVVLGIGLGYLAYKALL